MTDDEREAHIRMAACDPPLYPDKEMVVFLLRRIDETRAEFDGLKAAAEKLRADFEKARTELARKDGGIERLRAGLRRIANINNGPDRASASWRCEEAAQLATEVLERPALVAAPPPASAMERAERLVYDNADVFHPHQLEAIELIARAIEATKREAHAAGVAEGQRQMREEAALAAFDRKSDDPQPGDWNEACEHVAEVIRGLIVPLAATSARDLHSARIDNLHRSSSWQSEMEEVALWFGAGHPYASARIWQVILAFAYEKSGDVACDIIAHATEAAYQAGRDLTEPERLVIARIARKQMRAAAVKRIDNFLQRKDGSSDPFIFEFCCQRLREEIRALPDEMDPEEYPIPNEA